MGGFVEECVIVFLNNFRTLSLNRDKSLITHRSSGRKYDCWTKGLGFDFRVEQSITGLFSDF